MNDEDYADFTAPLRDRNLVPKTLEALDAFRRHKREDLVAAHP